MFSLDAFLLRWGILKGQRKTKVVVVPGKFDALHLGHRELAKSAASLGDPVLVLTFPGMAETLGWEPRKMVVPSKQRVEVFRSWSAEFGVEVRPVEVPFPSVRKLQPDEFVTKMMEDLHAHAVSTYSLFV